jgi:hypothetical protein
MSMADTLDHRFQPRRNYVNVLRAQPSLRRHVDLDSKVESTEKLEELESTRILSEHPVQKTGTSYKNRVALTCAQSTLLDSCILLRTAYLENLN